MGPKSLPSTQRCWEGEGLRRCAICVAPHCLQYTFRDWARYHATRSPARRCAHHLLAITSLPARKGVEISEGSAPDNDAAPSVAPLYHSLKLCRVASLEECSRTDLSTDRVTSRPSLPAELLWLGDVDYTTRVGVNIILCASGAWIIMRF